MHIHPSVTITPLAFVLLTLSCLGCQNASEAIVSIALHPTNANILYDTTNDAVYKNPVMPSPRGNGSRVSVRGA